MALGYLFLYFLGMVMIGIIGIAVLCLSKSKIMQNISFYGLTIFGMLVAYTGFTSQPTNFMGQRIYFCVIGILAVVAIAAKLIAMKKESAKGQTAAKAIIILAVVAGVWNLFF